MPTEVKLGQFFCAEHLKLEEGVYVEFNTPGTRQYQANRVQVCYDVLDLLSSLRKELKELSGKDLVAAMTKKYEDRKYTERMAVQL